MLILKSTQMPLI